MKRIYSHPDRMMVHHLKNLLQHEGLDILVKNDFSASGAGELPPTEVWLEIWLKDPDQEGRAMCIIEHVMTGKEQDVSWMCSVCHESNGPAFEYCWNCQSPKP